MPAYPLVGAHFGPTRNPPCPAKAILQVLPAECPLQIVPEPDNPYDENALKVVLRSADIPKTTHEELGILAEPYGFSLADILAEPECHLGYIPREHAAALAPFGEPRSAKLGFNAKGAWMVLLPEG